MSDMATLDRAATTRVAAEPIAVLPLHLTINGAAHDLEVEPWTTRHAR